MSSRRAPKTSDSRNYYEILQVPKDASQDDLKKAYRKLTAMNLHHGDLEKFIELAYAYEVLSDPEKRGIYEKFGEDLYGKERYGKDRCCNVNRYSDEPCCFDLIYHLEVSLEELYKGTSKKVSFKRDRICSKCKGTGKSKDQRYCCQKCKGDKVVKKEKTLLVHVKKGMQNGQRIIFAGEGPQAPEDTIAGNFVCVLKQKDQDLISERTLPSAEAHHGFKFVLKHLYNRTKLHFKF
ncbi:hypothetical protein M0R45_020152 [Rubus argutus]|uniref:J domain-containing protein n=1 Tax=Rubus argutus TaxID=59490 RepID=A0AAW1X7I2_RUBAR